MRPVWAIAKATFLEAIRDRILYGILLFALGVVLASALLDTIDLGERLKFLRDFVAASISFFGLVLSIFLGIGLVSKEIERRSVYWLLVKPLGRRQLLLGKYAGLVALLLLDFLILGAVFLLVTRWKEGTWAPAYALIPLLFFVKYAVVTAVALVFSTCAGPTQSVILTLGVYLLGHSTGRIAEAASGQGVLVETLARVGAWVVPDLARLSFHARLLHRLPVAPADVLGAVGYGLGYIVAALALACAVFRRREFD